jgi:hypothetical protein
MQSCMMFPDRLSDGDSAARKGDLDCVREAQRRVVID